MLAVRTSARAVRGCTAQVRWLMPAPSAAWDPSKERPPAARSTEARVRVTVHLPEDAVHEVRGAIGSTLLDTLLDADLNDVWQGGACGGACQCSTCRVVVTHAPTPLQPREEEEEDMLDVAATAAARQGGDDSLADSYLNDDSRLACQIVLRSSDDGLVVEMPDDVLNVLEVPLWLRGSR